MNRVTLLGRIGKDPEVRNTQSGKSVTNFSLATSEKWKDRDGQMQEKTEWHNVIVWGDIEGEILSRAGKGAEVFVEGQLTTRKWTDKSGNDRWSTEVVVQFPKGLVRVMQSSKPAGQGGGKAGAGGGWDAGDQPGGASSSSKPAAGRQPINDLDDDIPF